MSKIIKRAIPLILMIALIASLSITSYAATSITDNFSSGKVEDRWTNGYIDGTYNSTLNPASKDDLELKGIGKIEGGVLKINNKDSGGSFYYLAPKAANSDKGVQLKNFEVSLKVKVNIIADSWIGFSVRKKSNERYNGTNNVLMVYRLQKEGIVLQANRSYGGNDLSPLKKTAQVHEDPFKGDVTKWNTIKLVVKNDVFTGYVNNQKIGEFKYDKVMDAGFLSINVCVGDISIDDFKLTSSEGTTAGATTTKATTTTKQGATITTKKSTDKPVAGGTTITEPTATDELGEDTTTTLDGETTTAPEGETTTSGSTSEATTSQTAKAKSGFPVLGIVGIGLGVILVGGGAIFWFVIRPKKLL